MKQILLTLGIFFLLNSIGYSQTKSQFQLLTEHYDDLDGIHDILTNNVISGICKMLGGGPFCELLKCEPLNQNEDEEIEKMHHKYELDLFLIRHKIDLNKFYQGLNKAMMSHTYQELFNYKFDPNLPAWQQGRNNELIVIDSLSSLLGTTNTRFNSESAFDSLNRYLFDSTYQSSVLRYLSKIPVKSEDINLAILLSKLMNSNTYNTGLILQAVRKSGGSMCNVVLENILSSQSRHLRNIRISLLKLLEKKEPLKATKLALRFFGSTPEGLTEFEKDGEAFTILDSMIEKMSRNEDALTELLPAFKLYFGLSPFNYVLHCGTINSYRQHLIEKLQRILIGSQCPLSKELLLQTLLADSKGIQKIAEKADYSSLSNAPLLWYPDECIDALIFGNSKARNIILKIFKTMKLQHYSIYPEFQYERLYTVQQVDSIIFDENNTPTVPNISKATDEDEERLIVKSMINSIQTRLNLRRLNHYLAIQPYRPFSTTAYLMKSEFLREFLSDSVLASFRKIHFPGVSLQAIRDNLIFDVTNILSKTEQHPVNWNQYPMLLVDNEFSRRAILMYSLLDLSRRFCLRINNVSILTIDSLFNIYSKKEFYGLVHTKLVPFINDSLINNQKKNKIKILGDTVYVRILERQIGMLDGLYSETLELKSRKMKPDTVNWIGNVPIALMDLVESYPRILDFSNLSLATSSISSRVNGFISVSPNNLNLISTRPLLCTPILIKAFDDTSITISDVRDLLLLGYKSNLSQTPPKRYFPSPLQPRSKVISQAFFSKLPDYAQELLKEGIPGGLGGLSNQVFWCRDDSTYLRKSSLAFKPTRLLLGNLEQYICLNKIKKDVEKERDYTFRPYIWGWFFTPRNQNKIRMLNFLNKMLSIRLGSIYYLEAWDLRSLERGKIRNIILRQGYLNKELTKFTGIYELIPYQGESKFITISESINIPPSYKLVLELDRNQILEGNVDLGFISKLGTEYFLEKIMSYLNLYGNNSFVLSQVKIDNFKNYSNLYLGHPLWLQKSAEGSYLNRELKLSSKIFWFNLPDSLLKFNQEEVYNEIQSHWQDINTEIKEDAQNDYNKYHASLKRGNSTTIALGIFNGIPGISLSYNNFSISLSWYPKNGLVSNLSAFGLTSPDVNLHLLNSENNDFNTESTNTDKSFPSRGLASDSYPIVMDQNFLTTNITTNKTIINGTIKIPNWFKIVPAQFRKVDDPKYTLALLFRSSNLLTQKQFDFILKMFKNHQVYQVLEDSLFELSKRAYEAQAISRGIWIKTRVVKDLLKSNLMSSSILHKMTIENAIKQLNKIAENAFEKSLIAAKKKLKRDHVFVSGEPAPISLTYGNNFKVMRLKYKYNLVDSTKIFMEIYYETPLGLRIAVKQNPKGHVFEKFNSAEFYAGTANGLGSNYINPTEAQELLTLNNQGILKKSIMVALNNLKISLRSQSGEFLLKDIIESLSSYLKSYLTWYNDNNSSNYSVGKDPFIPPHSLIPFLNFFSPPREWSIRSEENLDKVLLYKKQVEVEERTIFIIN